jgi:hypothetical protein
LLEWTRRQTKRVMRVKTRDGPFVVPLMIILDNGCGGKDRVIGVLTCISL